MDIADLSALLGEDVTAEANADIWVVAPGEAAQMLIGEARRLADGLGCYVQAVAGTEAEGARALEWGADKAHVTADPGAYLAAQRPEFVLLPPDEESLAAQLAQAWGAGLITRAEGLEIDPETRALRGRHAVYGGEYYLSVEVTSPVKLATLDAARLPPPAGGIGREGEAVVSNLPGPETRLRDLGPAKDFAPPNWRPLSKAKTIVAVGRGVGGEAGLALARQLAGRLGAELAGDASARDLGWVDEAHEVGVTAQEVAPDLYVALGILGDTVHIAAIAGARRVIAVHANPEAPIFAAADEAVVGEPSEFLRQLLAVM